MDGLGHETCTLEEHVDGWRLRGRIDTAFYGSRARVEYRVACDPDFRTRRADVSADSEGRFQRFAFEARPDGTWWENGLEQASLRGCTDFDLNTTPATNTLPVRRLGLRIGESAVVVAAWLRLPEGVVEPLRQRYTRLEALRYRYESLGSRFVGDFDVDEDGLVVDYPKIHLRERDAP